MANYIIDQNYDLNTEKQAILNIIEKTDRISQLPAGFEQKCLKLFNYVVFSMLMPTSQSDYRLREDNEFLSYILIKVKRVVNYRIETCAMGFINNEWTFLFNPYFLFRLSILEMVQVIKHELYHMIWQHPIRMKDFENTFSHEEMNIALDTVVNQYLPMMPDGSITLETFKEMFQNEDDEKGQSIKHKESFEYYMEIIKESKAHQNLQQIKQQMQQMIQEYIEKNGLGNQSNQSGNTEGNGEGTSGEGNGGSGGNRKSYQNRNDMINKGGENPFEHHWEMSESDGKMSKEALKGLLNDARNKTKGDVPSHIMTIINQLNEKPVLEWQDYLKKFAGSVPVPYKKSIMRNDRRQPHRIELKGRLSNHEVKIVVAIDVSGSISDDDMSAFLNEILFILKGIKNKEITVIQCDADIQSIEILKSAKDVKKVTRNGNGGTEFSPVFEYLKKNNLKNDILIYLTDGYGESELTVKPSHFRTIWVTTHKEGRISLREPYGIVRIFDRDKLRSNGKN